MCCLNWLAKVFEPGHEQKLLDEKLRVENGDVSGSANQRICRMWQCMVNVVPYDGQFGAGQHRGYDIIYHFAGQ